MKLGILGTGHLAGFCCEGLRRSGCSTELIVSPHNPVKAEQFRESYSASIAQSNQQLVMQADLVLVAVRSDNVSNLLTGIEWPAGKLLISAMAGVKTRSISELVPQAHIVRSMPVSASSINSSPTAIYPDHPAARQLFEILGSVIPVDNEDDFEVVTANAALYGWIFALISEMVDANCNAGLSKNQSTRIVTKTLEAAAKVARQGDEDLQHLISGLSTPGGITEFGMKMLLDKNAITPWGTALTSVVERLAGKGCEIN